MGNHSIRAFATLVPRILPWVQEYSDTDAGLIQILMAVFVAVCIFLIMLQAYRQKQNGINPHLLLACTIGASLIPSVSHDYTLSILTASVAMVFCKDYFTESDGYRSRLIIPLLTFIFSVAYSSTLFASTNKPRILANNLPALMVMLFITTIFSLMSKPGHEVQS
jgi:hypothetical protein